MILVSRRSYDDSIAKCGVHDLLRELAIEKVKDNKFLVVFINNNVDANFGDARRILLQSWKLNENDSYGSSNKLRSLFIFGDYLYDFSSFRLLKVLHMHKCSLRLQENKWFKELIQLRYVEFNYCMIADEEIREEICHMQNLQIMNFEYSSKINLPESMWSIKTLRHIIGCIIVLPPPLDGLTLANLQTLWHVRLKHTLGELYSFPSLCELGLYKISNSWDPITSLLRNKTLRKLVNLSIQGGAFPLDVVDMRRFIFFEHLQCLKLWGSWCQDVSLSAHFFPSCLTMLELHWCEFPEDPMPELGKLQNLKMLYLGNVAYMGRQMTCPAGDFPQLRELSIYRQPDVEDLSIEEGTMSMLKKLEIYNILSLRRIPDLQSLTKLEEFVWERTPFSEEEIQMMRQENQHKLNHIRSVIVTP